MALLMEGKINQFGASEEYWKVLSININSQYRFTDITLGGYVSEETRDNGSEPINTRKVRAKWSDEEYAKYFSPESFGVTNPTPYITGTETPEEIEQIVFLNSNIFERAYYYVKDMDAELSQGQNI